MVDNKKQIDPIPYTQPSAPYLDQELQETSLDLLAEARAVAQLLWPLECAMRMYSSQTCFGDSIT